DERTRRLTMVDGVGNGGGGANLHQTEWTWDRSSRLLTMKDAESRATSYIYDSIGRLKEIDYPDTQKEFRIYNGDGTIATSTDQNSSVATFTYGPDDQPEQITYLRGAGVIGVTSDIYAYDRLGRLTSASSDGGVAGASHATSRTYDSLDR